MQLTKYQAAILAFLFERLPIGDDVDTLEFSLTGDLPGKYRVAYARVQFSDQIVHIVFTLPSFSDRVYLALTRTNVAETARVLANLEELERESSKRPRVGEVIVTLPSASEHEADRPIILLRTATSIDCAEVPDEQVIGGKQTSFVLAVPLTLNEWMHRRLHGHDALMDRLQECKKELFF